MDQQTDKQPPKNLPINWQAVWDDDEKDYYYWNTETNETTWDLPGNDDDKICEDEQKVLDTQVDHSGDTYQSSSKNIPQIEYQDYVVQAQFNSRTNKFSQAAADLAQTEQSTSTTEQISITADQINASFMAQKQRYNNGAMKQLNAFFNYDEWIEQRNQELQKEFQDILTGTSADSNKVKKPTKSQMKRYRQKKVEKKKEKQKWLYED